MKLIPKFELPTGGIYAVTNEEDTDEAKQQRRDNIFNAFNKFAKLSTPIGEALGKAFSTKEQRKKLDLIVADRKNYTSEINESNSLRKAAAQAARDFGDKSFMYNNLNQEKHMVNYLLNRARRVSNINQFVTPEYQTDFGNPIPVPEDNTFHTNIESYDNFIKNLSTYNSTLTPEDNLSVYLTMKNYLPNDKNEFNKYHGRKLPPMNAPSLPIEDEEIAD